MFGHFFGWLLSVTLAFFIGANVGSDRPADSELQQKVQDHMDVIIDESAAIVDDVNEEMRNSDVVQDAQKFADDVKEIAQNTADDIDAHFGKSEETEGLSEEAVTEVEETTEKE